MCAYSVVWLWMPTILIEDYMEYEEKLSLFGGKNEIPNRCIIWKYILNFQSNNWYQNDVTITEKFVDQVEKMISTVTLHKIIYK